MGVCKVFRTYVWVREAPREAWGIRGGCKASRARTFVKMLSLTCRNSYILVELRETQGSTKRLRAGLAAKPCFLGGLSYVHKEIRIDSESSARDWVGAEAVRLPPPWVRPERRRFGR